MLEFHGDAGSVRLDADKVLHWGRAGEELRSEGVRAEVVAAEEAGVAEVAEAPEPSGRGSRGKANPKS